jgi:hypothetical protein
MGRAAGSRRPRRSEHVIASRGSQRLTVGNSLRRSETLRKERTSLVRPAPMIAALRRYGVEQGRSDHGYEQDAHRESDGPGGPLGATAQQNTDRQRRPR